MIRRYIVGHSDGVNHKFSATARRPNSFASAPSSRAGRTFGGGAATNFRHGAVAHFKSSRAIKTRRGGGRSAIRKKCLLWRQGKWTGFTAGAGRGGGPDTRARNSRQSAPSRHPQKPY